MVTVTVTVRTGYIVLDCKQQWPVGAWGASKWMRSTVINVKPAQQTAFVVVFQNERCLKKRMTDEDEDDDGSVQSIYDYHYE